MGAGGTFALAYIVVADLSPPEKRGKMMGLISFVWGVASILGPAMGGFVVAYFSWRWIFYINGPLGCMALLGIVFFLKETRGKKAKASIDFQGSLTLTIAVLSFLTVFLLAGRSHPWLSIEVLGLLAASLAGGIGFYLAEKRAREPILALDFFRSRDFSLANGSAFFSSFTIFSLSAFSPLFIQGTMGKSAAQLGMAMVPLSLGWSIGAMTCGQLINRRRERPFCVLGSLLLAGGSATMLTFSDSTTLLACSAALGMAGLGMGFVSIPTLLIVQNSLDASNLGVATSSQQFARTLGGAIGIGVTGSLVTARIMDSLREASVAGSEALTRHLAQGVESLFQPDVQALLSPDVRTLLKATLAQGVELVFWASLVTAVISLFLCLMLSEK